MTIMIGIDPHKATHTAVAIDSDEKVLEEFTLRASKTQTNRLRTWASQFDDTQWAVEGVVPETRTWSLTRADADRS